MGNLKSGCWTQNPPPPKSTKGSGPIRFITFEQSCFLRVQIGKDSCCFPLFHQTHFAKPHVLALRLLSRSPKPSDASLELLQDAWLLEGVRDAHREGTMCLAGLAGMVVLILCLCHGCFVGVLFMCLCFVVSCLLCCSFVHLFVCLWVGGRVGGRVGHGPKTLSTEVCGKGHQPMMDYPAAGGVWKVSFSLDFIKDIPTQTTS